MSIRIVLATDDQGFAQRLRASYPGGLNGDLRTLSHEHLGTTPAQAVAAITAGPTGTPEVVALGPGMPVDAALDLARQLDLEHPETSIVLVAKSTPKLWAQAMRAGVRDILDPPATGPAMAAVFERAGETAMRRRVNLVGQEEDKSGQAGRVIAVISPKGGAGKTTVSTNLAVGLARAAPGQAVIVDLDMQFGDVASALSLLPEHTMVDAALTSGTLDATALKVVLTPHSSGLFALCAPDSPAEGEQVTGETAATIIRALSAVFRYVVVDTSAGLTEHALSALEVASDIVLVCSMDVPSVRSLRKAVDALDALGMTAQRRHLVLNRADSRVGLEAEDVEATVGMPVDVAIPSSRAVPLALNQGTPLLAADARHPVSEQLAILVGRFAVQHHPVQRGFLDKLRSAR